MPIEEAGAYSPPIAPPSDQDPAETQEWIDSVEAVARGEEGAARAAFLLRAAQAHSRERGYVGAGVELSAYRNTVAVDREPDYPGDLALERKLVAIMRWNAIAMVVRANKAYGELGGHVASYASAAEIFEVGFNHFFRGGPAGDLVYFQPHSAPGVYSRAFLEGRLSEAQLGNFRRELGGNGLCSYPHPWLMPDFWQFPTGSMGIGPINAIYQARFLRYLEHRGLVPVQGRRVWGVFGDGEMDEPESVAALTLAAREKLSHVGFVINCNLQRLDGPVRGNGQIVQELEGLFLGAGWNVVKVLWGSEWDALFARDPEQRLLRRLASMLDGELQTLGSKDAEYSLEKLFRADPELAPLFADLTAQQVDALTRGGHDLRKLQAAFAAAVAETDKPTVILALTKKGFGMGGAGESRMTAHQTKKLDFEALKGFRTRFELPLSDDAVEHLEFYRPAADSPELAYLAARREALGGYVPSRRRQAPPVAVPAIESYAAFALSADGKEMSTTMAAVRIMTNLLRDPELGPRIVPIVADEARTFGMAGLFRQIGIYSPEGQRYEPEDHGSMLSYREAKDGQFLEEGITEAGALSSWVAAGTAYSVHGVATLPFYIYYSMFGFQRVGDLIWAAADQRTRGFLLGATAGRTTLGGEGLQHQDGSSHVMAAMVPNCRAYDPAFAGELAVILDHGARQMTEHQVDEFYYVTVMNESYAQPSLPAGVEADVLAGMYRFGGHAGETKVTLLGSGAILREVIAAAELLATDWQIGSDVFSVTSFSELARDAQRSERHARLHPAEEPSIPHVERLLAGHDLVIAATDYVRAYPELIAPFVPGRYVVLGTDGFGRSDTRVALRRFFEVDRHSIVLAALHGLAKQGKVARTAAAEAIARYEIDTNLAAPWER